MSSDRRKHDRGTTDRRRETLSEAPLRAFIVASAVIATLLVLLWVTIV
jgi:hypothetical protein